MKLVVVTVSNPVAVDMSRFYKKLKEEYGNILDLKLFYVGRGYRKEKLPEIEKHIGEADFVLTDLMGAKEDVVVATVAGCKKCSGDIVNIGGQGKEIGPYLKLGSLSAKDMKMGSKKNRKDINVEAIMKMMDMAEKMGKFVPFGKPRDMRNFVLISKYWTLAGEGIEDLFYLILREYGKVNNLPKPRDPKENEPISICDPLTLKIYRDWAEYADDFGFDKDKAMVAVLYRSDNYPHRSCGCVGKFCEKLSEYVNVLPVAFNSVTPKNVDVLEKILLSPESPNIDLIVNVMSFRLGAGPMGGDADKAVELLKKINVPQLHPYLMAKRELREWEESVAGISPPEFLVSVMLPELDGSIESIPIGAIRVNDRDEELDLEIGEIDIIEDRVTKVISRINNWINLRKKPNKDKKVAIICYNYPPGEDNIFGGAFLDTFVSIEKIMSALKDEGYNVDAKTSEELMEYFTQGKIVNSGKWIVGKQSEHMITYEKDKYSIDLKDKDWYDEMISQWGEVPGEVMTEDKKFLIPGKEFGNVFVGLQPSRGVHENPEKCYHDKTLLPHHQYIAFYKWLKEEFKADAVVHVGTHGTLEFLKGKECGMSKDCFSDMLVYDIPHAYLYYCGNPAESVIAKRRSHAVLVGYQSPPYTEAELYGEMIVLETLISELKEAERVDPIRCDDLKEKIKEKASELNFDGEDLDMLERELYRIKRSLIPRGLHIFGQGYTDSEACDYMRFLLRYDRGNIKAIRRLVAENEGLDYEELLDRNDTEKLAELDEKSTEIIEKYVMEGICEDRYSDSLEFGRKCYNSSKECYEIKGLLKVLNGEYLPAKLAGDTIRSPEVLPTGYNLYQFDPRLVPSEVACERGAKIADNTIKEYMKSSGEYPKTVAMVLWGLETSRTQGETLGQIFHYLGVRIVRNRGFDPEYEIIPLEELGRPRIDITINMCGFFRDMFYNMIQFMNKIFKDVYLLDEPDDMNYFKANTKKIYKNLLDKGYSPDEAGELAVSRIFGPKEGDYGTGITTIIETKNWTSEEQLGDKFIDSLKYVYSLNHSGKKVEGLLEDNLKTVDIVSQTRSNHEYEVTDLDHYYEFFGGLAKSIEMVKGKKAEIYISDTTGESIETETVDKSIERGVRTRLLNPKWIDAMLEHKYHGVQEIYDRFENIIGLSATTNKVDNWVFDSLQSTYVSDEELREKLKENNRWAYLSMMERLLEANQRGYWDATDKQLEELRKVYIEVEGSIEEKIH
ncbi:magnesium chelatase subunit H [Anaerosalibacter sp. Marseille-P3206]|uniref:magnesium chelatase subunit H n=1 Tax=Anaerosalibacter sp. Marseille-P3206 TaxID=1871005 RepID=UPI0009869DEC|nr:magnesium chelatase subunit H [Anaerosalibacter sp. Marseille-P3206]